MTDSEACALIEDRIRLRDEHARRESNETNARLPWWVGRDLVTAPSTRLSCARRRRVQELPWQRMKIAVVGTNSRSSRLQPQMSRDMVGDMDPITPKAALLQALLKGDSYGLELIDLVKERTKGKIVLRQATIYPALREMEAEGLLRSYESDPLPERGGRPRRYYKITAQGRRVAMEDAQTVFGLFGGMVPT